MHKPDDGYFINKRQGQSYVAVPVEDESVYLIIDDKFERYVCAVYHLDGDVKEVIEVELLEHRNSKPSTTRPYIRTSKSDLEQQD